jgi:hypothetical protein
LRRALLFVSLILIAVAAFARWDPLPDGVTATYFADDNWSSSPVLTTREPRPSSDNFLQAWKGSVPQSFSATWSSELVVLRGGSYTFAIESDDGSSLYIDRQLIVDNPGRHEAQRKSGTIELQRGDHSVFIEYFQAGGRATLELSWARNGSDLTPIPSWAFVPRHAQFRRLALSVVMRRLSPVIVAIWLVVVALSLAAALRQPLQRLRGSFEQTPELRALTCLVVVSIVLSTIGVWWGVPSGWAGDEIGPTIILNAIGQQFSHGWFERYPPFHMQLLSVAVSPLLIVQRAGLIHLPNAAEYGALLVISRLVSVLAAAGTIVALFHAGREAFGAREGVLGAAAFTLLTPFLYYAKTANAEVPYVFWFTVSLVFYLRLQRTAALGDVLGFALAAVLSICTKDQAYGLYLLTPVPLLHRLWQSHRAAGSARPLVGAMSDRRLWIPLAAAVVLFSVIHNIPFNLSGFLRHVRNITGPERLAYQMVDAGIPGDVSLLRIAAMLNQRSWGWPLWMTALAGLTIATMERSTRRPAILLITVAVSYYLGFINVVRYVYDRYLLPICLVEALFVGVAFERLLRVTHPAWRAAARPAIGVVFVYTLLYAGTVDVLMVRDGRYAAEEWLRRRNEDHRLVGIMFPTTVLPRLRQFEVAQIRSIDELRDVQPEFFLLNADYARAVPIDQPEADLAAGLQRQTLGYRLAFRSHTPPPWPWLPAAHPNLVGPRDEVPVLSVLTEINPTIEIYTRDGRDGAR